MIAQKKLNEVNDKIIKLQEEQIEILELRNRFLENKIARVLNKVNIEL